MWRRIGDGVPGRVVGSGIPYMAEMRRVRVPGKELELLALMKMSEFT